MQAPATHRPNAVPLRPSLAQADFQRAAARLGIDVAAVKAVCAVEAPRGGFLSTGEPTILFERHKFYDYTDGRFYKDNPDICNPRAGGYGPYSAQHDRLQRATKLDRAAALKATSWGMFQILGVNYSQAGFPTLQAFINAMYRSESDQLDAFVAFVANDRHLANALKAHDWAAFAKGYNGPGYAKNSYDKKLAAAYAEAAAEGQ